MVLLLVFLYTLEYCWPAAPLLPFPISLLFISISTLPPLELLFLLSYRLFCYPCVLPLPQKQWSLTGMACPSLWAWQAEMWTLKTAAAFCSQFKCTSMLCLLLDEGAATAHWSSVERMSREWGGNTISWEDSKPGNCAPRACLHLYVSTKHLKPSLWLCLIWVFEPAKWPALEMRRI